MKTVKKRASISIAAACALALTTALAGPAAFAEEAASETQPVPAAGEECVVIPGEYTFDSGTLTWGIRSSFTDYIVNKAHGAIEPQGVQWNAQDMLFTFTATSGEFGAANHGGHFEYAGSIRFTAHGGVLDTTFSNLKLVIANREAHFVVDAKGKNMDGSTYDEKGIAFAKVDMSKHRHEGANSEHTYFDKAPVVLTEAGTKVFAGFYKAGEALDVATGELHLVPKKKCTKVDPKDEPKVEPKDEPKVNPKDKSEVGAQPGVQANGSAHPKVDSKNAALPGSGDKKSDIKNSGNKSAGDQVKTTGNKGLAKTGSATGAVMALSASVVLAGLSLRRRFC